MMKSDAQMAMRAPKIINLSASGSINLPKWVMICFLRAILPSRKSVMAARMKMAAAMIRDQVVCSYVNTG